MALVVKSVLGSGVNCEERDQALSLLRNFIERIDMTPVDGGFEIELSGNIGRMVGLSLGGDGNKKGRLR